MLNKTLKIVLLTAFITVLLTISVGVAAVVLTARDIPFASTDENWKVNNVEDAMNDLYKNGKIVDDLRTQISDLESQLQSKNWTMVVSYDTSLGWSGNYAYGSQKGYLTIKSIDGEISISNTGGVISSPTDSWNGNYYINAATSNFKIESFTLN